jgi:hypothetical protein
METDLSRVVSSKKIKEEVLGMPLEEYREIKRREKEEEKKRIAELEKAISEGRRIQLPALPSTVPL